MKRSEAKPALPAWIFIVTDLALIGAGAVIALRAEEPLTVGSVIAIVACVSLGAIAGLIPLVASYERQKNEILDARQRVLEGMAQTLAASAEQISIATGSLHQINEAAQRNLQQAAQLPQKLQDKVTQLQDQIAAIRLGDTDKLETAATRLARAAAELAKHEAAANEQAAGSQAALAKLSEGADAIVRAQGAAVAALEAKLAEIDARLKAAGPRNRATAAAPATTAPVAPVDTPPAVEAIKEPAPEAAPPPAAPATAPTGSTTVTETNPEAVEAVAAAAETIPSLPPEVPVAAAPKRPRKPRQKETPVVPAPAEPTPAEEPATIDTASPAPVVAPVSLDTTAAPAPAAPEPTSAPAAPAPEAQTESAPPVTAADPAAAPAATPAASVAPPTLVSPADAPAPEPAGTAPVASEPSPRKRAPRKAQPDPEPSLDLPLEDTGGAAGPGSIERTISSDGATRLIATSYIGIGNRLFIRGEGAGLSWDRGAPLQFVSIGKWRWETNEAVAPVRFKLLKNDEQECTALGEKTLEPGHLHELSAQF